MSPENCVKRACAPETTALVLLGVLFLKCGWAVLLLQVAVLINAAQVKLEGCRPAVDFYLVDVLSKKVYNLNRSAPFLKHVCVSC